MSSLALPNTDKKVAVVSFGGLTTSFSVTTGEGLDQYHGGGRGQALIYWAEATFKAATAITSLTWKIQLGNSLTNVATATATDWFDLPLTTIPGVTAVDQVITAVAGATVPWPVYCPTAHLGRKFFRLVVKIAGGPSAAGDAFNCWGPG